MGEIFSIEVCEGVSHAISEADSMTQKQMRGAARCEHAWICPDCCCWFGEGMPNECPHSDARCTDLLAHHRATL